MTRDQVVTNSLNRVTILTLEIVAHLFDRELVEVHVDRRW
jgi:hypothetical protein